MKIESIKKNREFRYIYANGKSGADRNLVLHYIKSERGVTRFGITVSKKVGGAVVRNKIKRRIKEIIRLKYNLIPSGYDIIFVVRRSCAGVSFAEIQNSVEKLLAKAALCLKSGRKS